MCRAFAYHDGARPSHRLSAALCCGGRSPQTTTGGPKAAPVVITELSDRTYSAATLRLPKGAGRGVFIPAAISIRARLRPNRGFGPSHLHPRRRTSGKGFSGSAGGRRANITSILPAGGTGDRPCEPPHVQVPSHRHRGPIARQNGSTRLLLQCPPQLRLSVRAAGR